MDLSFLRPHNVFNKKVRIILTGGGSGGHTFPLIAICRELKKIAAAQNIELDLMYIGPGDFTLPLVQKEIINIKKITTGKLQRDFSFLNIIDFFKTFYGLLQAMIHVYVFMPDFIISKGGYGSFPVALWGIIFMIPTYIHESDTIPGLANKIIGKFAKEIFISFESSSRYFPVKKTIVTGNPIREDLFNKTIDIKATKKLLDLSDRPIITILGGSQGAKNINDLILDILPKLIDETEIIHQVGENNYDSVLEEIKIIFQEIIQDEDKQKYYHPVAFLEETETPSIKSLGDIILISDLIIARAGSGSIFEIAASGKPSILIPLPWASSDHQKQNAYEYAKTGAAIVVEEQNLKPNIFADLILTLLNDKQKLKTMKEAAQSFAKPKAAEQIAQHLLQNT